MVLRNKTVAERLAAYTKRSNKCLLWTGALNDKDRTKGYGVMNVRGRMRFVHQLAYELTYGTISSGKVVRHTCDNRLCCEPTHLILGTHKDNTQDMVLRGRSAKGEDHGRAKITEQDALDIRTKFNTGNYTKKALSDQYGITVTAIRAIVTGKTWKHVR